ncbi:MAG: zinc ribbon domain-containing protein [Candidatus Nitrosocaldaceae archaeon]
MEDLGYNTKGPLIEKLKNLLNDVQSKYEEFLDALTLFEQGKLDEREFFIKMGEFVKIFTALGFLSIKVILELDKSISKQVETKPQIIIQELHCKYCNAKLPPTAKFCTKCGKKQ